MTGRPRWSGDLDGDRVPYAGQRRSVRQAQGGQAVTDLTELDHAFIRGLASEIAKKHGGRAMRIAKAREELAADIETAIVACLRAKLRP